MRGLLRNIHHFFVPSARNNYRARLLHLDVMILLIIAASIVTSGSQWVQHADILGYATDIRIDMLYEQTNKERVAQSLPPLTYSNQLAHAAENKAQHMFTYDYWAHFGGGKTPWDFILDAGYSYQLAGENLAKGFMFTDGVIEGWKASPTHYENIIKPEYDDVGFAVVNGTLDGEETTLVVQMFGTRLAQAAPASDTPIAQDSAGDQQRIFGVRAVEASGTTSTQPKAASTPKPETAFTPKVYAQSLSTWMQMQSLRFNWSSFIFVMILIVLAVDLLVAHSKDFSRMTGKNIAHMIFLITLIIGLLVIKNGVIL